MRERFIGPIIEIVDFTTGQFRAFSGKRLSATLADYELTGEPDGIIATGDYDPHEPYFCLYEYKQEIGTDPVGQLLISMLVAQSLNTQPHPIYGAYVMGRHWYFVVLEDKEYAISRAYDASQNDIFEMFKVLRALREIIKLLVAKR